MIPSCDTAHDDNDVGPLFSPLTLPCGLVLKNRIAKAAMSDSLGDGTGHPTEAQAGSTSAGPRAESPYLSSERYRAGPMWPRSPAIWS